MEKIQNDIDRLEIAHQELKKGWFEWARGRYSDGGIGSDYNSKTAEFLRTEGKAYLERCNESLRNISAYSKEQSEPKDRYQIFRELYYIHPSFHEHWFYYDHLTYDIKSLIIGKHGFGIKDYLNNPSCSPSRLKSTSTFTLKRTILLENLLASKLDCSLFDQSSLTDTELVHMASKYQTMRINTIDEIVTMMPDLFRIILTILEKTQYSSLIPERMISTKDWLLYALCAVNEGPIFQKVNPKTRCEIFSSLNPCNVEDLRTNLKKYYSITPIRDDIGENPHYLFPILMGKQSNSVHENTVVRTRWHSSEPLKASRANATIHEQYAQDNGVADLYSALFNECMTLFPAYEVMGNSVNFRVENVLGHTMLDAFNLFPRQSSLKIGLKFQAYTHVIGTFFKRSPDMIARSLPTNSRELHWCKKETPDATGLQGYFKSGEEVERFLKGIRKE